MKKTFSLAVVFTVMAAVTLFFVTACSLSPGNDGGGSSSAASVTNSSSSSSVSSVGSSSSVSSSSSSVSSSVSSSSSLSSSSSVSSSSSSSSSSSLSSSSSSVSPLADIKRVYSERTDGTAISMNPSWEVWPGSGDSVVFSAVYSGAFEGYEAIECAKGNQTWMGFVLKSQTDGSGLYPDMTGYKFLHVALKATADLPFSVQVGVGNPATIDQYWYDVSLTKDGNWYEFYVAITNVSVKNLTNMSWMFAMRSKSGTGLWSAAPSSLVYFDDVYFSKTNQ